jgi:hypothetical protein
MVFFKDASMPAHAFEVAEKFVRNCETPATMDEGSAETSEN